MSSFNIFTNSCYVKFYVCCVNMIIRWPAIPWFYVFNIITPSEII